MPLTNLDVVEVDVLTHLQETGGGEEETRSTCHSRQSSRVRRSSSGAGSGLRLERALDGIGTAAEAAGEGARGCAARLGDRSDVGVSLGTDGRDLAGNRAGDGVEAAVASDLCTERAGDRTGSAENGGEVAEKGGDELALDSRGANGSNDDGGETHGDGCVMWLRVW
jgi:hypothetical protein